MRFLWPIALLGLLLLPLVVGGSMFLGRRGTASSARETLGRGVETRHSKGFGVRNVLVLLALTVALVGFARPTASVDVPYRRSTVMLAFDTSTSMQADDLDPTRLGAAKAAATDFVTGQPDEVEIGVVSFGNGGVVTLRPSTDRVAALASIDRLQAAGGTSLTQGLFASLAALADGPLIFDPQTESTELPDVDFGGFGSAIIIMFSDGEDTSDQDPALLTELAAAAGIRVYTVGIGSVDGAVIDIDGFSVATSLDEAALEDLADRTNGTYFRADETTDLVDVSDSVDRELAFEPEDLELTAIFALVALVLAAFASVLAMRTTGRMP